MTTHSAPRRWSRRHAVHAGLLGLTAPLALPSLAAPRAVAQATPLPMQGDAMAPGSQLTVLNLITDALANTNTPGAIVGAWVPGQGVAMIAAGLGELPTATAISLDDHVRIASISKTFTATVVLQLVDEGALTLDDRLADFVEGIPNGVDITIRQLLSMRSGVFDYSGLQVIALAHLNDMTRDFAPTQAVDIIRQQPAAAAPGSVWQYSNSNYVLLGLIIEKVTGQTLPDVLNERIITPLGLTTTSLPTDLEMPAPYAHGYTSADPRGELIDVSRQNPNFFGAAGGMVSTLLDLKVWGQALATGALLSPAMHAAQIDPTLEPATPGAAYGLGVLNINGLIGHNGNLPGYESWLLSDPDTGTTLVVLANRMQLMGGAAALILGGLGELFLPAQFSDLAGEPVGTPVATPTG